VTVRRTIPTRGAITIAALALVLGLAAPTLGANAAAGDVMHNPKGKFLGVVPSRPSGAPAGTSIASPHTGSPVTYHSGPVQHSSTAYAIFWAPSTTPFSTSYATTISTYFKDVAHDSFTATNPYGADVQYWDGTATAKKFLSYAVTFKGAFVDSHAYPANGCPNYLLDDGTMSLRCLTDAQIVKEIKAVITAHAFPKGIVNQYFLFTPKGIASCFTSGALSSGGCYDPQNFQGYCAYHSFSGTGTTAVLYANMHFANITGCSSGQSPSGNDADSVINEVSHEHQETMTDPLGTAWYDVNGNEIADKCVFTFGAPLGTSTFGQYNEVINTHKYWLQEIWSNRASACVQRNTYPQPTASFTYSPSAPVHGTPVAFHSTSHSGDGTALTFRWLFPTATSTSANPSYTFASAGTKQVTLIVADTHGDQKKVTRAITVS
jgi:PKD repeat protein